MLACGRVVPPAAVVNLTFIGVLRDFSVASERYGTSSSIHLAVVLDVRVVLRSLDRGN